MTDVSNDLSENVSKLVELTKQLKEAKSDIKVLNQAEKQLKENIKKCMMDQGIDTINLRKGKISLRKTNRKSTMTKDAIKDGLGIFFGGNEAQVEGAMNAIQDNLKMKETVSLAVTGIKDKDK
jgi:accessory colonization factor AcfC